MSVTAIPLLVLLFFQYRNNQNLLTTLSAYEESENAYVEATVYLLSENVSAGEQITSEMLTSCSLRIPHQTSVNYVRESSKVIGSYARTTLKKGSILNENMFIFEENFLEKGRIIELTDLILPDDLCQSDLLEIRISFPTGEDFVVLDHQKIHSFLYKEETISGISLALTEEELLRFSSARVDAELYKGTTLYAVIYQADYEIAADVDYPVNADVFSLMQWDPNMIAYSPSITEQEQRYLLEEHLQRFEQLKSTNSYSAIQVDKDYNILQY